MGDDDDDDMALASVLLVVRGQPRILDGWEWRDGGAGDDI